MKEKKSYIWSVFMFVCVSFYSFNLPLQAYSFEKAVVMNGATGDVLFEQQAYDQTSIASLTKIMTAVVAIEYGQLTDETRISHRASGMHGSSVYLKHGQRLTLEDLLYALMLRSGNDASLAIAEMIGGSEAGFVYLMNEKARLLGLSQTTFKNPHGLDEPNHLSSAYDLAVLSRYALSLPEFIKVSGERAYQSKHMAYPWIHKHKLVKYSHTSVLLGKTGYTKQAGRTLMTVFQDDVPVIVVTLNATDDWNDHRLLFKKSREVLDQSAETPIVPYVGVLRW